MHFPMRIQPIDSISKDLVKPVPVYKSRLKRLFERPFISVLRNSLNDKPNSGGEKDSGATVAVEFEPSSICLDKMVQNFIEDNNIDKISTTVKCGRKRCNCFNRNIHDSSDDDVDFNNHFSTLKSLIACASMVEIALLADTSQIVQQYNKICKRKDDLRKIVTANLTALGYNASVCKSRWEKSSSLPAGDYEYIDVKIEGERVLIDVDFRSEFEVARSTSRYTAILQSLPYIFVGKSDRLLHIISTLSEAARQSLKRKGMHVAPWRKPDYMKSKWLGPYTRIHNENYVVNIEHEVLECDVRELDLIFGKNRTSTSSMQLEYFEAKSPIAWQLPAVRPKSLEMGNKVVTGLASLLKNTD